MANGLDENQRKDLYRKMLVDNTTSESTKKYSFKEFENKILGDEKLLQKISDLAVKREWALDQEDFFYKYAPEKAAPAPKPQAAPKQQIVYAQGEPQTGEFQTEMVNGTPQNLPQGMTFGANIPATEQTYIPPPQPAVGSREYDAQLQKQYGGMSPTLGATFGGAAASFETPEQKKQEQISPAFKAQQLAFEDVPIASEQKRAQREFAKATKEQQKAAVRGGTGFEYEKEKKAKERGIGEFSKDFDKAQIAMAKQVGENMLTGIKNQILEFSNIGVSPMAEDEPEAVYYQREASKRGQQLYQEAAEAQRKFQEQIANSNIETSVLKSIEKGDWNRVPEAVAYTIGEAAVQMAAFVLTKGGSAYVQTLPQEYKDEVDAIAAETNRTPEQVIADGDDAPLTAKFSSGIQYALEKIGMDQVSKSMASRGAYKAVRDWLLKNSGNRTLARTAGLGAVSGIEAFTEFEQTGTSQAATLSTSQKPFLSKVEKFFTDPELKRERAESAVAGGIGGLALGGGGQLAQSAMDRTLFEAPKIGKATQRVDYNIVQTDDKIQQRNKMLQAMESAIQANPEAEGQIRERYRKLTDALELTDQEVLDAYDGIAQLPPSPEKDRIIQGLEAYMAEKGIQPQVEAEAVPAEEVRGTGRRIIVDSLEEVPQEYRDKVIEVAAGPLSRFGVGKKKYAYVVPTETIEVAPEETIPADTEITDVPFEEVPAEEVVTDEEAITEEPSLEESLLGIVPQEPVTEEATVEEAPVEEVAPEEEVVAEEEVVTEEAPQPKAGDFVIVNGEKGIVVVTPGGQMSVETDTKIYDLDERGIAGIGGRLVAPKEKTQTEYEVEVLDDDNALVNGEPFQIIRDEKGNTIALQGQTRTIRTEPVMVDVDIKRNKAQVRETPQQQAEEVESLSPDMTLDKQGFVDDIIGQNMTEGVDRILSDGVTEKTQEKDLLQFKLFVEATIADLRARQKGNPYADAMIEQLQEALNTVYYEYYSQGRKAEARTSKTEKKTNRGAKGKERVSPKPAEGKQPAAPKLAPVTPPAPKVEPVAEKPQPKKEEPVSEKPQPKKEELSKEERIKELEKEKSALTSKALKQFPNSPIQLKTRERIDEINKELDGLKPKEEKPTIGTPQEGDTVDLPPQTKYTTDPRKMVFKDGQWKQKVGGEFLAVGESVQKQAQEAFSGKTEVKTEKATEVKPAETKPAKKAAEAEFNKGDKVMWEGEERTILSNVKMGNEWKYQIDLGKGKSIWTNGLGIELEKAKAEKAAGVKPAETTTEEKPTTPFQAFKQGIKDAGFKYLVYSEFKKNNNTQNWEKEGGIEINGSYYNTIVVGNTRIAIVPTSLELDNNRVTESPFPDVDDNGNEIYTIQRIVTPEESRGEGSASKALLEITKAADKAGLTLQLEPVAIKPLTKKGGKALSTKELADWYKRNGFVQKFEGSDLILIRTPKTAEAQAATTTQPSFTSKQESSASTEFDGTKKPSKIKMKTFDGKHGNGAFERMQNITQNFEDIMDGLSEKIKQDCL
jgi:hypothetical protein